MDEAIMKEMKENMLEMKAEIINSKIFAEYERLDVSFEDGVDIAFNILARTIAFGLPTDQDVTDCISTSIYTDLIEAVRQYQRDFIKFQQEESQPNEISKYD